MTQQVMHSHYQEPYTADLEQMNLPDAVKEAVIQARIEAETIRAGLASENIAGWPDLLRRLDAARTMAQKNAVLFLGQPGAISRLMERWATNPAQRG